MMIFYLLDRWCLYIVYKKTLRWTNINVYFINKFMTVSSIENKTYDQTKKKEVSQSIGKKLIIFCKLTFFFIRSCVVSTTVLVQLSNLKIIILLQQKSYIPQFTRSRSLQNNSLKLDYSGFAYICVL